MTNNSQENPTIVDKLLNTAKEQRRKKLSVLRREKFNYQQQLHVLQVRRKGVDRELTGKRTEYDSLNQQYQSLFNKTIKNKAEQTEENKRRLAKMESERNSLSACIISRENLDLRLLDSITQYEQLISYIDEEISSLEAPCVKDTNIQSILDDYAVKQKEMETSISSSFNETMLNIEKAWQHANMMDNITPLTVSEKSIESMSVEGR